MRVLRVAFIVALAMLLGLSCTTPRRVVQQGLDERAAEIGQPTFFVDWTGFQSPDTNLSRLEIYYQVFNFGLQFLKDTTGYRADYVFSIVVNDGNGKQIRVQEQNRSIYVTDYAKTVSRFDFRTSQENFDLPPGNYSITAILTDQNSKSVSRRTFTVPLKNFQSRLPVSSDVEFVQAVVQRGENTKVFDKGDMTIIPSPSRYYGGDDSSKLLFYFEVYQGDKSLDKVNLETIIQTPGRGRMYHDTTWVALDERAKKQLRDVSIDEFPPGDYELQIRLLGRRGRLIDQHSESFSVQWTQEGLLKHDFETALAQLRYIALPSEIKKMRNLKTYEERMAAFNAFWASRDPSPGTRENETKREFYRRITYANRQFRHLREDGWRTDRGRIYIQFGEPDQIDDVPMSLSYPPYQIWHYYREGRYRRFAFLDKNDDGDYRLQYPYDGLDQTPDF